MTKKQIFCILSALVLCLAASSCHSQTSPDSVTDTNTETTIASSIETTSETTDMTNLNSDSEKSPEEATSENNMTVQPSDSQKKQNSTESVAATEIHVYDESGIEDLDQYAPAETEQEQAVSETSNTPVYDEYGNEIL